ncbi:MAG: hypothetical protein ACI9JN_001607 [Bacteroidia bacterium]|jgi:hypothetical protein
MFQANLFDTDVNVSTPISFPAPVNIKAYFSGNSLVKDGVFTCTVGTGAKAEDRPTYVEDAILVYRNLNKPKYFSMKQAGGALKGKVSGYAQSIVVKNPCFKISEASRQRVLRTNRNVHSYVTGEFVDAFDGQPDISALTDYVRVTYSPYVGNFYYTFERDADGQLIKDSIQPFKNVEAYTHAIVNGSDVLLCCL